MRGRTQGGEKIREQRGGGRAVHVIIAEHRDGLAAGERLGRSRHRHIHVFQDRRIGQQFLEPGLATGLNSPNNQRLAPKTSRLSRRRHWEMLLIACGVMLFAPLLRVYPPDRVGARWSAQALLPPLCASRQIVGTSCPGCGLTRSFVGSVWLRYRF